MNPAEAMSRRSSCSNSMLVQGPPRERTFQSCIGCSSHLWTDVSFDHWAHSQVNCALRRAHLLTGRQECLRATAQPLLHWPLPPLWGSWIFEEFPVHLSLDFFCSTCAQTLQSRLRILPLLAFSKRVPALPRLRQESRTYLLHRFLSYKE